jgi:hypothetical protein
VLRAVARRPLRAARRPLRAVARRPLRAAALAVVAALLLVSTRAAHAGGGPAPLQTSPAEQPALGGVPPPTLSEALSSTWPLALGAHVLIGVEPHDRGNPIAFGVGAELLWRARLGGFVMLLASEGTPIIAPTLNGAQQPSFADRISIPFGFAARPLAPFAVDLGTWTGRLLTGIGLQLGLTIEHLRTSDDSATTAGLHLGLGVDVPLWGGTKEGGVALRLYGRLLCTPAVTLDNASVYEPIVSGQIFAGISYYP